ncbi:MAG: primosomal protein N' [Spirochaetales bacterium]|nr:primosomal protein N' [Spirochaetales bacterium]
MKIYYDVVFNLPVHGQFAYTAPDDDVADVGCRVLAPFGKRLLKGYIVEKKTTRPPGSYQIKSIEKVIDKTPLFDAKFLDLAKWISWMYMCSLGEALSIMLPGGKKEVSLSDILVSDAEIYESRKIIPAPQQSKTIDAICGHSEGAFYVYGVTGSGKTHVYLSVAKDVLEKGRDVIYLVPEISLTHQIVEVCRGEFGDTIAVLHSGLTPVQKLKEWGRIINGDARFIIGARSGVFAPTPHLGLIIVDEEHEGAYKSSSTPRYHARQVALKRCRSEKAICIMGSATPSLEAYHQMKQNKIISFHMPKRLGGGKMPRVEIVDMKNEKGAFSKKLIDDIKHVHQQGLQTILFLNRRGFSYYFHCKSCGFEMKCRHCSVSLTFHKQKWKMICHYCGYATDPVKLCPECRSLDVGYSGFGTEKIEEDIKKIFPFLHIKRIDTDTVRKKGSLQSIISDFKEKKIDMLLGTQMVAKGLNFPGVQLVGIISADTGLNLPDFRAAERTHHLIVQVSGRAGRVNPDGKVIVQTVRPENEAIRSAAQMKSEEFYERELAIRQDLGFPPFSRLIRLVFRGSNDETTYKTAQSFYDGIESVMRPYAEILGPAECPISIISKNHRYHLIFRAEKIKEVHAVLRSFLFQFKSPNTVYCEIDVDPVSLL